MKTEINYELINDMYISWLNERDAFIQRKIKDDIKSKFSPYEFLMYCERYSSPFKTFRNIFPLCYLFETLKQMQKQGKDISNFTHQSLLIETPEEIRTVSNFAKREPSSEINNFGLIFKGQNIFEYGDIKSIGEKFPYAYANNLSIQQVEQMVKSGKDYKGIPITITIDNISELPLEKLSYIEECFDVDGIKIVAKNRAAHNAHQGECTPLNLRAYKQIRNVVDNEILNNLYIDPNLNRMNIDLQLSAQILDKLANKIEYDFDAAEKPRFSKESKMASGLVGLLTGKSICKGYSEILRNVLGCVGIDSVVIDGVVLDDNGEERDHSWNLVKLGDFWLNVDLTNARENICAGKPTGNLFMSDMAFYDTRKKVTLEKGKQINGKSMESTVMIGGHVKAYGTNNKQCKVNISPALTSSLIQKSRLYAENYEKDSKNTNYQGIIPYVGSTIEQTRSSSKNISGIIK